MNEELDARKERYNQLRAILEEICANSRDGLACYTGANWLSYLATPDWWSYAHRSIEQMPWSEGNYNRWGGMISALEADWRPNQPISALERLALEAE